MQLTKKRASLWVKNDVSQASQTILHEAIKKTQIWSENDEEI